MTDPTEAAPHRGEPYREIPSVLALNYGQYAGWNCVFCGCILTRDARLVGISRGSEGAHVLDVEVYAGPCCP